MAGAAHADADPALVQRVLQRGAIRLRQSKRGDPGRTWRTLAMNRAVRPALAQPLLEALAQRVDPLSLGVLGQVERLGETSRRREALGACAEAVLLATTADQWRR